MKALLDRISALEAIADIEIIVVTNNGAIIFPLLENKSYSDFLKLNIKHKAIEIEFVSA